MPGSEDVTLEWHASHLVTMEETEARQRVLQAQAAEWDALLEPHFALVGPPMRKKPETASSLAASTKTVPRNSAESTPMPKMQKTPKKSSPGASGPPSFVKHPHKEYSPRLTTEAAPSARSAEGRISGRISDAALRLGNSHLPSPIQYPPTQRTPRRTPRRAAPASNDATPQPARSLNNAYSPEERKHVDTNAQDRKHTAAGSVAKPAGTTGKFSSHSGKKPEGTAKAQSEVTQRTVETASPSAKKKPTRSDGARSPEAATPAVAAEDISSPVKEVQTTGTDHKVRGAQTAVVAVATTDTQTPELTEGALALLERDEAVARQRLYLDLWSDVDYLLRRQRALNAACADDSEGRFLGSRRDVQEMELNQLRAHVASLQIRLDNSEATAERYRVEASEARENTRRSGSRGGGTRNKANGENGNGSNRSAREGGSAESITMNQLQAALQQVTESDRELSTDSLEANNLLSSLHSDGGIQRSEASSWMNVAQQATSFLAEATETIWEAWEDRWTIEMDGVVGLARRSTQELAITRRKVAVETLTCEFCTEVASSAIESAVFPFDRSFTDILSHYCKREADAERKKRQADELRGLRNEEFAHRAKLEADCLQDILATAESMHTALMALREEHSPAVRTPRRGMPRPVSDTALEMASILAMTTSTPRPVSRSPVSAGSPGLVRTPTEVTADLIAHDVLVADNTLLRKEIELSNSALQEERAAGRAVADALENDISQARAENAALQQSLASTKAQLAEKEIELMDSGRSLLDSWVAEHSGSFVRPLPHPTVDATMSASPDVCDAETSTSPFSPPGVHHDTVAIAAPQPSPPVRNESERTVHRKGRKGRRGVEAPPAEQVPDTTVLNTARGTLSAHRDPSPLFSIACQTESIADSGGSRLVESMNIVMLDQGTNTEDAFGSPVVDAATAVCAELTEGGIDPIDTHISLVDSQTSTIELGLPDSISVLTVNAEVSAVMGSVRTDERGCSPIAEERPAQRDAVVETVTVDVVDSAVLVDVRVPTTDCRSSPIAVHECLEDSATMVTVETSERGSSPIADLFIQRVEPIHPTFVHEVDVSAPEAPLTTHRGTSPVFLDCASEDMPAMVVKEDIAAPAVAPQSSSGTPAEGQSHAGSGHRKRKGRKGRRDADTTPTPVEVEVTAVSERRIPSTDVSAQSEPTLMCGASCQTDEIFAFGEPIEPTREVASIPLVDQGTNTGHASGSPVDLLDAATAVELNALGTDPAEPDEVVTVDAEVSAVLGPIRTDELGCSPITEERPAQRDAVVDVRVHTTDCRSSPIAVHGGLEDSATMVAVETSERGSSPITVQNPLNVERAGTSVATGTTAIHVADAEVTAESMVAESASIISRATSPITLNTAGVDAETSTVQLLSDERGTSPVFAERELVPTADRSSSPIGPRPEENVEVVAVNLVNKGVLAILETTNSDRASSPFWEVSHSMTSGNGETIAAAPARYTALSDSPSEVFLSCCDDDDDENIKEVSHHSRSGPASPGFVSVRAAEVITSTVDRGSSPALVPASEDAATMCSADTSDAGVSALVPASEPMLVPASEPLMLNINDPVVNAEDPAQSDLFDFEQLGLVIVSPTSGSTMDQNGETFEFMKDATTAIAVETNERGCSPVALASATDAMTVVTTDAGCALPDAKAVIDRASSPIVVPEDGVRTTNVLTGPDVNSVEEPSTAVLVDLFDLEVSAVLDHDPAEWNFGANPPQPLAGEAAAETGAIATSATDDSNDPDASIHVDQQEDSPAIVEAEAMTMTVDMIDMGVCALPDAVSVISRGCSPVKTAEEAVTLSEQAVGPDAVLFVLDAASAACVEVTDAEVSALPETAAVDCGSSPTVVLTVDRALSPVPKLDEVVEEVPSVVTASEQATGPDATHSVQDMATAVPIETADAEVSAVCDLSEAFPELSDSAAIETADRATSPIIGNCKDADAAADVQTREFGCNSDLSTTERGSSPVSPTADIVATSNQETSTINPSMSDAALTVGVDTIDPEVSTAFPQPALVECALSPVAWEEEVHSTVAVVETADQGTNPEYAPVGHEVATEAAFHTVDAEVSVVPATVERGSGPMEVTEMADQGTGSDVAHSVHSVGIAVVVDVVDAEISAMIEPVCDDASMMAVVDTTDVEVDSSAQMVDRGVSVERSQQDAATSSVLETNDGSTMTAIASRSAGTGTRFVTVASTGVATQSEATRSTWTNTQLSNSVSLAITAAPKTEDAAICALPNVQEVGVSTDEPLFPSPADVAESYEVALAELQWAFWELAAFSALELEATQYLLHITARESRMRAKITTLAHTEAICIASVAEASRNTECGVLSAELYQREVKLAAVEEQSLQIERSAQENITVAQEELQVAASRETSLQRRLVELEEELGTAASVSEDQSSEISAVRSALEDARNALADRMSLVELERVLDRERVITSDLRTSRDLALKTCGSLHRDRTSLQSSVTTLKATLSSADRHNEQLGERLRIVDDLASDVCARLHTSLPQASAEGLLSDLLKRLEGRPGGTPITSSPVQELTSPMTGSRAVSFSAYSDESSSSFSSEVQEIIDSLDSVIRDHTRYTSEAKIACQQVSRLIMPNEVEANRLTDYRLSINVCADIANSTNELATAQSSALAWVWGQLNDPWIAVWLHKAGNSLSVRMVLVAGARAIAATLRRQMDALASFSDTLVAIHARVVATGSPSSTLTPGALSSTTAIARQFENDRAALSKSLTPTSSHTSPTMGAAVPRQPTPEDPALAEFESSDASSRPMGDSDGELPS